MTIRALAATGSLLALASTLAAPLAAQDAPIIQPGAPSDSQVFSQLMLQLREHRWYRVCVVESRKSL